MQRYELARKKQRENPKKIQDFPFFLLKCYVLLVVSVEISNMGDEVFLDTMLTIGTTDTRLLDASVEALHGLEVLAVDVGLAEFQLTSHTGSSIDVLGED